MLNKRPSWSPLWSATTRRGDRLVIRSTNAIDLPNEHCNFNCMKLVGFREERLKYCDSKCMVSATEIISTIKRNRRDPRLRVFFQGLPTSAKPESHPEPLGQLCAAVACDMCLWCCGAVESIAAILSPAAQQFSRVGPF